MPQREQEALKELEACLLDPLEAEWADVQARRAVDAAWGYWTLAAEEVLLALSLPQLAPADVDVRPPLPVAPATKRRERGTGALVRDTSLCPREQKHGGAPETLPLTRIHAAQGALRIVLRWLRRPDPRPGAAPREVPCAWGAARNRLRKVREMGPAFAALPRLEAHEPLPGEEAFRRAMEALRGMAGAQRAREDGEIVRAWREWLDHAWSSEQGAVYRWLGGEGFAPPGGLSGPGGRDPHLRCGGDGCPGGTRLGAHQSGVHPHPPPTTYWCKTNLKYDLGKKKGGAHTSLEIWALQKFGPRGLETLFCRFLRFFSRHMGAPTPTTDHVLVQNQPQI